MGLINKSAQTLRSIDICTTPHLARTAFSAVAAEIEMSAVAVFAAFVVGRIIIDNVEELVLRERETIARCVSRVTAGPQGPTLDLASALRDVGEVNRAFANPALGVTPRPGWRYRATLVYKPGLGQEAFFRALRIGPRLASLMGTVCVDLEEVAAISGTAAADDNMRGADEGEGNFHETTRDAEAEYEHVAGPCRRASLSFFYTLLRPAMRRIAVDATTAAPNPYPQTQTRPAFQRDDDGDDDGVCTICMDGTVDTVTKCGHAYCEECYLRWLAVSLECPLCRSRLGRHDAYALIDEAELSGDDTGHGRLTGEQEEGTGGEYGNMDAGEASTHGATWLNARLAALPPVAEQAGGQNARIARLLRRLRAREAGGQGEEGDLRLVRADAGVNPMHSIH